MMFVILLTIIIMFSMITVEFLYTRGWTLCLQEPNDDHPNPFRKIFPPPSPVLSRAIVESGCTGGCSCGGSAVLDDLDAVVERDSLDDLGEVSEAPQPAPGFLRAPAHLVDHREHGLSGDAAFGSRASMADRGEGRLDDVGGSKVRPVGGGEVVEREQLVAVASQAGGGLGGLVVVPFEPLVEGALGLRPGLGSRLSRSRAAPA